MAATQSNPNVLSHRALAKYWASERRAILVHRFYLSIERAREVTLEDAVASWEGGACSEWRQEKSSRDCSKQMQEIERHKYHLSEKYGRDVGWETAAQDWVRRHAAAWREWWEQQPDSGA